MIITQTPFRMSFFGGGTDIESFFKKYGGAVISTTFDKYCYVNVRHLPRFFDYTTEISYSRTERVTDIQDIKHPAVRNAMEMLDMHELRLTYEADLPARSGLGTSSSFAVGMLNAFLLMFFTGFTRFSSEVQKQNAMGKENKVVQLREMLSLVDDAEQILTDKNTDLDEFGKLLDHTWRLKRQTGSAVSTENIDLLYEKGIKAGALGGKLLGAGGGGFLVFYVQPEQQEAVKQAMNNLMYIPFEFEDGGTRVIHYTPETYIPKE